MEGKLYKATVRITVRYIDGLVSAENEKEAEQYLTDKLTFPLSFPIRATENFYDMEIENIEFDIEAADDSGESGYEGN